MSYLEAIDNYPYLPVCDKQVDPRKPRQFKFSDQESEEFHKFSPLEVYLRVKPENGSIELKENYFSINGKCINVLPPPVESHKGKSTKTVAMKCRYEYTDVFGPDVGQTEVFDKAAKRMFKKFLSGQNCLLFSFGTTSSGKTFTIQGTGKDPGIIPRVLVSLFMIIKGREDKEGRFCPDRVRTITELNEHSIAANQTFKDFILSGDCKSLISRSKASSSVSSGFSDSWENFGEVSFQQIKKIIGESVPDFPKENFIYSVWVSFVEVYNEYLYDLLEPPGSPNYRRTLRLAFDTNKTTFVKGLRHINVCDDWEAFKVFQFGRTNLSTSPTYLNTNSSRSHAIFTIKLLKRSNENSESESVSSFSICDMAGTERQKKANNIFHQNLKESQNINTSHLVLNRCFKIIRENQNRARDDKMLVPFRDSKITQLFQRALCGEEILAMIVNISQDRVLMEETQVVLKSSALAHEIEALKIKSPVKKKPSRFSVYCNRSALMTTIPWESPGEPSGKSSDVFGPPPLSSTTAFKEENYIVEIQTLKQGIESLKQELDKEKGRNSNLEEEVRQKLFAEFEQIYKGCEEVYKQRLKEADEKYHLERNKKKLIAQKICIESWKEQDIKKERDDLLEKFHESEKSRQELLEETRNLSEELTSYKIRDFTCLEEQKILRRLIIALEDKKTSAAIFFLQEQIQKKDELIKEQEVILSSAKEDFLDYEEKIKESEQGIEEYEKTILTKEQIIEDLRNELHYAELKIQDRQYEEPDGDNDKFGDEHLLSKLKIHDTKNDGMWGHECNINLEEIYKMKLELAEKEKDEAIELKKLLDIKVSELEENIKKTNIELKEAQDQLFESNNKIEVMSNNLFKCDERLLRNESQKEEADKKEEALKQSLQEIKNENEILHKRVKELTGQVHTIINISQKEEINLQNQQLMEKRLESAAEENVIMNNLLTQKNDELECLKTRLKEVERNLSLNKREYFEENTKKHDNEVTLTVLENYRLEKESLGKKLFKTLEEIKRRDDCITTLEEEKLSLVKNRDEIFAKYEEELRRSKEELEREKREISVLKATFLRPNSTPKKQLEEELEKVKKELEVFKQKCENLTKSIEKLEDEKKENLHNLRKTNKNYFRKPLEKLYDSDEDFLPTSKTTTKKNRLKKKDGSTEFSSYLNVESNIENFNNSKRKAGRKLFVQSCEDLVYGEVNVELESKQSSPNTAVRKLRGRKVINK